MAVGVGTVTTAPMANGATTTTVSFTSTSQPLYVIVSVWRAARTLNTVTFNAVGLTRVAQASPSNGDDIAEIWRLTAPSATTANVVLTWSGTGQSGSLALFNTTGQDTTTPEGTATTSTSTVNATSTGSQTITGAASGDLTIFGVAIGNGAAITPSATGGSGLTELFDAPSNGEGCEGARVSDACTAVSASWTGSTGWAIAAIPLKASGGGGFDPTTVPPFMDSMMPFVGQRIGQY